MEQHRSIFFGRVKAETLHRQSAGRTLHDLCAHMQTYCQTSGRQRNGLGSTL